VGGNVGLDTAGGEENVLINGIVLEQEKEKKQKKRGEHRRGTEGRKKIKGSPFP